MIVEFAKGEIRKQEQKEGAVWYCRLRYRCIDEANGETIKSGQKWFTLKQLHGEPILQPTKARPQQGKQQAEKALEEAKAAFKNELLESYEREKQLATPEKMKAMELSKLPIPAFVAYVIDGLENGAIKRLEPSTIAVYRNMNKIIAHYFSDVCMSSLTPLQIDQWKAYMYSREQSGEKIGTSTQVKAFNLLQMAYTYAEQRDVIDTSPFRKVSPIKRPKAQPNRLTDNSFARLCTLIDAAGLNPFTMAVRIALETGLREGEICGLQWGDIDLENSVLHVRRTLARADGKIYKKEPKTEAGRRSVPITERMQSIFTEWKNVQLMQFDEFKGTQTPSTYVLGDVDNNPYNPVTLSRDWRTYSKANGIMGSKGKRAVFHDLRHTYVSQLAENGIDPKTVSQLAGHASVKTTLDIYADTSPRAKRAAIDSVAPKLWDQRSNAKIIPFKAVANDA